MNEQQRDDLTNAMQWGMAANVGRTYYEVVLDLVGVITPLVDRMIADDVRAALEGGPLPDGWKRATTTRANGAASWRDGDDPDQHVIEQTVLTGPWREVDK